MKENILIICFVVFFCTGCTSTLPVMRTIAGTYKLEALSSDRGYSIATARKSANKYCKQSQQVPVVVKEETVYQGILDEDINRIAKVAGNVAWDLGKTDASTVLGDASSDSEYQTTIEFECR